jgi:hypothetical protein
MLGKLDVTDIVGDHLATFVHQRDGRRMHLELGLFFVIPLLGAGALLWSARLLTPNLINILVTALSIFAGLLFNLLVLVHGLLRGPDDKSRPQVQRILIKEIHANVSYAILVSLVSVAVLVACMFKGPAWAYVAGSFIVYALAVNVLLTLVMILSRMHTMMAEDFEV